MAMRTKIVNTTGTITVVILLDLGLAELFDAPDADRVVLCVEAEEDLVDIGTGSVINVGWNEVENEVVVVVDDEVVIVVDDEVVLLVTATFT